MLQTRSRSDGESGKRFGSSISEFDGQSKSVLNAFLPSKHRFLAETSQNPSSDNRPSPYMSTETRSKIQTCCSLDTPLTTTVPMATVEHNRTRSTQQRTLPDLTAGSPLLRVG